jgi:hypothetical protein
MIDQMIHYRFDVGGSDMVPCWPLFREIGKASTVSADIALELFDDLFGTPYRVSAVPRVLVRPWVDVSAQPCKLEGALVMSYLAKVRRVIARPAFVPGRRRMDNQNIPGS